MKLTSLEIERARRITERDATLSRLGIINDRIDDLEQQKEDVLEKIDAINCSEVVGAAPAVKSAGRSHLSY